MTTLQRWQPIERALAAYCLLAAAVCLIRLPLYPPVALAAVAHLLIAALLVLLGLRAAPRWSAPLRAALPIFLLPGLYALLDVVNLAGTVPTWDSTAQAVEQALFAGQPSRDWWRAAPSAFWSTLLHAAYFSYYALILGPALLLLMAGTTDEQQTFMARVVGTFLCCYVVFVLFPVSGPYYQFTRPSGEFIANYPARLVYASLQNGSSFGAAFPSSHVAATVATTAVLLRLRPGLGRWFIVPTALLTVSVVYCAMHYAVDAIAGLAVGLLIGAWPLRRPIRTPLA